MGGGGSREGLKLEHKFKTNRGREAHTGGEKLRSKKLQGED